MDQIKKKTFSTFLQSKKDLRLIIGRLLELFFDDPVVGADGDGREEDVGDREVGRADAGDGRWRHPAAVDRHAEDQTEDQRAGTQHDPQNPERKQISIFKQMYPHIFQLQT